MHSIDRGLLAHIFIKITEIPSLCEHMNLSILICLFPGVISNHTFFVYNGRVFYIPPIFVVGQIIKGAIIYFM